MFPLPDIPDANVSYVDEFYAFAKANSIYKTLLKEIPWRQNKITVFGKEYDEPRLTQLYGEVAYGYSGIDFEPLPWSPIMQQIKDDVEKAAQTEFNVCLVNLYRDGQDSNGWHADNEKNLGVNPVIASVSFGQERFFHLKHNSNKEWRFKFPLTHGSLLIMAGQTQHTYKHQIAKTARKIEPRMNLTFRKVVS
jgi:alkylated DNA repair dioxygenase AlkB